MKPIITGNDIQGMVTHHLGTPPNGYLGSAYGSDIKTLLQNPEQTDAGDEFLSKMRADVPVLSVMPDGAVNLYIQDTEPDRRELVVDIAGQQITVG